MICMIQVVSFPDLIQHVYYLLYNMQYVPKVIRAAVGFGSGTETVIRVNVKWMCRERDPTVDTIIKCGIRLVIVQVEVFPSCHASTTTCV